MKNGEFDVYVKMSGRRVEEYSTTKAGEQLTSCYIASEEGKVFSIHCDPGAKTHSYRAEFRVDGRTLYSCCSRAGRTISSIGPVVEGNYRPYQFSRLLLSADDEADTSVQSLDALGTIEVHLWRVTFSRVPQEETPRESKYDATEIGVVHERSKKAGSHCVSFGADVPAPKSHCAIVNREFIDPRDTPRYIFRFQYRSQDILQAQGIIPPIPKPQTPVQLKRSAESSADRVSSGKRQRVEGLKDASEVKLEADLTSDGEDPQQLQAELEAIKARIEKAKSRSAGRVKREHSPIRLTTTGDIIDLTSD